MEWHKQHKYKLSYEHRRTVSWERVLVVCVRQNGDVCTVSSSGSIGKCCGYVFVYTTVFVSNVDEIYWIQIDWSSKKNSIYSLWDVISLFDFSGFWFLLLKEWTETLNVSPICRSRPQTSNDVHCAVNKIDGVHSCDSNTHAWSDRNTNIHTNRHTYTLCSHTEKSQFSGLTFSHTST